MSRTNRQPCSFYENLFKFDSEYKDRRKQISMLKHQKSYCASKICPITGKIVNWKENSGWAKPKSHRAARRESKLIVSKMAHDALMDIAEENQELIRQEEEWESWMYEQMIYEEELFGYEEMDREYLQELANREADNESYYDYEMAGYDWDY